MPRPQFRLRSLFILTAIVAGWSLVGRWSRLLPDHDGLFFTALLELIAFATMMAIIRAHDG